MLWTIVLTTGGCGVCVYGNAYFDGEGYRIIVFERREGVSPY